MLIEEFPVDEDQDLGTVAMVTINRPDKLNALNAEVMSAIKAMVAWVESTAHVRVVVITGAQPNTPPEGKRSKPNAFVAGADIPEFLGRGSEEITAMFTDNAIEALWNMSKPSIAMVDGFALGGGLEVACSCDIRIASTRSKFGTPEINLGLIPGYGGTQRLSSLVGKGKAIEMITTGGMLTASEAKEWGLVNYVCSQEEIIPLAEKIASKIKNNSPTVSYTHLTLPTKA